MRSEAWLRFEALIITTLLAFSTYPAFSQRTISLSDGKLVDEILSSKPTRDVDITGDSVVVTYRFNSAVLIKDDIFDGAFWWKVEGFGHNDKSGEPSTLFRIDQIAIPIGFQAKLEVAEVSYKDFPIEIAPARPPLTDSGNEIYSKENVIPINSEVEVYPKSIIEECERQVYRGTEIISIKVSPMQYDNKNKTIRAYSLIKYRVTFSPSISELTTKRISDHILPTEDQFLSNTTLNGHSNHFSLKQDYRLSFPTPQDYLIISIPRYAKAVESFANWKRTLGFRVHTVLKNGWTSSDVRTTVENIYRKNRLLCYLLIIGDYEDVPASISNLMEPHVTDLFYGCMDGDDDYTPDISRGRIPVNTSKEAIEVVNKIIQYELAPSTSQSFYERGLNCAYFQDDENDGYADRRFAQTAEDVRTYLTSQGKKIQRAYFTPSHIYPQYWNKGTFSYGEPLPASLRKPHFRWDANKTDITATINDGVFYVLHRDHGGVFSWGDPAYNIHDIYSLSNVNRLPVVFSINCLTGKFNNGTCFAEAFLKKPIGGCVGIFAATETSYSGYNDVLTGGLFDAIWPYPGLRIVLPSTISTGGQTPSPSYRLGQVLDQGFARMIEVYGFNTSMTRYTQEIFHYFGDPSMRIYTKTPTPFSGVKVLREGDRVRVSLKGFATISFYNPETNAGATYVGTNATFITDDAQGITVCISKHNKIPYVDYGKNSTFIQNETITDGGTYSGQIVKIGTNVTNSKPYGDVLFEKGTTIIAGNKIEIYPNTTLGQDSHVILIAK